MNSELSYIHSQAHSQELFRAAQREHLLDVAETRSPKPRQGRTVLNLRAPRPWRALATRRAAVGKA